MKSFRTRCSHALTVLVVVALAGCSDAPVAETSAAIFTPLKGSARVFGNVNGSIESTAPWIVPDGVAFRNLTSLREVAEDPTQSTVRIGGLSDRRNASMFDMNTFDSSGRFLFVPHEVKYGGGLSRYDLKTDKMVLLFQGDGRGRAGDWRFDFGSLDPATLTPRGTILVAEEWSGEGRVFEVSNIFDEPGQQSVKELDSIPNVSHEGLQFNKDGTALYMVDEDRSGSIYKFVPTSPDSYARGQTFVLVVDRYQGDPRRDIPKFPRHSPKARTGSARWVPLTDVQGTPLTASDPFDNSARGGRSAADELGGTPFGRPEDIEVKALSSGNEAVFFTATEERAIYAIEELGDGKAHVKLVADQNTRKNAGFGHTAAKLDAPDNLAQDRQGNIYVVEDGPNSREIGGDVWLLRDANNDGVAESLDLFLSLRVKGAEASGMVFRPMHEHQFAINVQHPTSTGLENGFGDSIWLFDMSGAILTAAPERDRSR